jgi:hypothetical protein
MFKRGKTVVKEVDSAEPTPLLRRRSEGNGVEAIPVSAYLVLCFLVGPVIGP